MGKLTKVLLIVICLAIMALTGGCKEDAGGAAVSGTNRADKQETSLNGDRKDEKASNKAESVKVYFANEDATKLVGTNLTVSTKGPDKYTDAIAALLKGSNDSKLVSPVPDGTRLLGLTVSGDVVTVDFSGELVKNFNGGSAGEMMLVGSIVNTLTAFPEIKRVQIVVEGRKIETISGHMDMSEPLARFERLLD